MIDINKIIKIIMKMTKTIETINNRRYSLRKRTKTIETVNNGRYSLRKRTKTIETMDTKTIKITKKKRDPLRKISDKLIIRKNPKRYPIHCGPIALYNLLVRIEKPMRISILNKLCSPHIDKGGTSYENFTNAVDYINKTKHINILEIKPKKDNIINIINNGGYVIILYGFNRRRMDKNGRSDGEHYILIDNIKKKEEDDYLHKTINPNWWINKSMFDFFLTERANEYFNCPKVWALSQ